MATREPNTELISRREAVLQVSSLFGGALVAQSALLTACTTAATRPFTNEVDRTAVGLFPATDVLLLDEIADTMLPETDTPGARAAGVGPFMALMVTDAYEADEQRIFRDGLVTVDDESRTIAGVPFRAASRGRRLALIERLDREQYDYMRARRAGEPVHYFRMIKELALLGYFTSEIGYTQAMRYVESPGRFDPCVPLEPGGKTWAPHA